MQNHNIEVLIDWSEDFHQVTVINKNDITPLGRICEIKELDEPDRLNLDYYFILDSRNRTFALVSIPKEVAKEEMASGKDAGSTVMEFAYKQWGCTKLLHWSHKQMWWDNTYDEEKLAIKEN